MTRLFSRKVALITGAASGIGRAAAFAFAHEGAKVVVTDVQPEQGEETAKIIRDSEGEALFVPCDVSKAKDVENLIAVVMKNYEQLDFAFNNAGIEGQSNLTADCTEDNWERVLAINLKGIWLCMKHEIHAMLRESSGAIVNCASVAGLIGFPGLPAYVASKHGVVGLTKTAALEYAKKGIRINAVCPGAIRTPMLERLAGKTKNVDTEFSPYEPIGRVGQPEEVAEAVVWLCSAKASFVIGHALPVDGGWVAQ